ncbi:MAG: rubrerythrin [Candidatus Omnitrophica bacterium]|nr:rubrerythrin [Candidatus Omnitrophota bacterium]
MGKDKKEDKILERLTLAFTMELETVINYLSNSTMLDGVRAEEIKTNLAADVAEELLHATQLAKRIKQLGGRVPGSLDLDFNQKALQPPKDTTDVMGVIKGVIGAEENAIANYKACIRECNDAEDYVTPDLCIRLLTDEEAHLIQFRGFLKEYETK